MGALLYGQRKVYLIKRNFLVTLFIQIKEIVCCSSEYIFLIKLFLLLQYTEVCF